NEENAEARRRGERSSGRIRDNNGSGQAVGAEIPKRRKLRRGIEAPQREERVIALERAARGAEIIREVADTEGGANRGFTIVGRIRQTNSGPPIAVVVVDIRTAIIR